MTAHIQTLSAAAFVALVCSFFLVSYTVHAASTIPLCEIQRGLAVGATGEDVRCLQRYLNWSGVQIASTGAGAPGNETAYYGPLTASAVSRWQESHAAQVLTPLGLSSGTGYWGSASFAAYIELVKKEMGW